MGCDLTCTAFGSNPVRMGVSSVERAGVPSIVYTDSGLILLPSVLSTIHNCVFDKHGKLERISLNLLNMFARAYTAVTSISGPITDRALARKTACLHSKRQHKGPKKQCTSRYHVAEAARDVLDDRSRIPLCRRCYTIERTFAEASWPTIEVLKTRIHDGLLAQIQPLFELPSCRRWLMSLVIEFPHHDLQLHSYRRKEGAIVRAVCPSAKTLFRMARSPRAVEFDSVVHHLVTYGWADFDEMPANFGSAFYVFDGNLLVLSELVTLVRAVAEQKTVELKLVPRDSTIPEWTGPCHTMTWHEIIEAVRTGLPLYGARVSTAWCPFEVLVSLATHQSNVVLAPIGPEHSSATTDPDERAKLLAEARNPWNHTPLKSAVWRRIRPGQSVTNANVCLGDGGFKGHCRSKRRRLQGVPEKNCKRYRAAKATIGQATRQKPGQRSQVRAIKRVMAMCHFEQRNPLVTAGQRPGRNLNTIRLLSATTSWRL